MQTTGRIGAYFVLALFVLLAGKLDNAHGETIIVPPGPMFWTMSKNSGGASFFADRGLNLCASCSQCDFEPIRVWFTDPVDIAAAGTCEIVPKERLIQMDRLDAVVLADVGATDVIGVSIAGTVFEAGSLVVDPNFECSGDGKFLSASVSALNGQMTVRREHQYGGTFDLRFDVFVDLEAEVVWPTIANLRLGPYEAVLPNLRWAIVGSAGRAWCGSCVGEFAVEAPALPLGQMLTLQGVGTTWPQQRYPVHLNASRFLLPLWPVCEATRTSVKGSPWSVVKVLYR